jgi:hypothetical protein
MQSNASVKRTTARVFIVGWFLKDKEQNTIKFFFFLPVPGMRIFYT